MAPMSTVFQLEDVLYHILDNLSTKVLDQVARVNVTWNRVVKKIKQNRKLILWCYYNESKPGGVEEQIGQILGNLTSEPHFALIFGSVGLKNVKVSVPPLSSLSGTRCLPRAVKREQITFSCYLERTLHPSSRMIGIVANRITAIRLSSKQDGVSASCLFLPKLDGVDIYQFNLGNTFDVGLTKATFSAKTGIPDNKHPKLILIFWRGFPYSDGLHFVHKILNICGDVVIAGSFVNLLFTDTTFINLQNQNQFYKYVPVRVGVGFCGGSDLRVTSVVIQADKKSEELVEAELARLKADHVPEKCSVAFLFCSNSRLSRQSFAGKGNGESVESKVFNKLFPDVPLFGFSEDAEIGFDSLAKQM